MIYWIYYFSLELNSNVRMDKYVAQINFFCRNWFIKQIARLTFKNLDIDFGEIPLDIRNGNLQLWIFLTMCVLEQFRGSGVNSLHFVANGNEMTCQGNTHNIGNDDRKHPEWWMQRCILEEGICDRNYKNDHFLIHHVTQYSLGLVLYFIFAKCHTYLMV